MYGRLITTSPTGEPKALIGAAAFSPSLIDPVWQKKIATMGLPCISLGSHGAGGAGRIAPTTTSSGGALSIVLRHSSRTSGASSARHAIAPPMMSGPTGYSLYSKLVTTPKFPPPPRRAHRRSWFSVALAVTTLPSAVTTSIDTTLSQVHPYLRVRYPIPPPSVSPPIPVFETKPISAASP